MVITLEQIVKEVLSMLLTKVKLKIRNDLRKRVCCKVALVFSIVTFMIVLKQKVKENSHGFNFFAGVRGLF